MVIIGAGGLGIWFSIYSHDPLRGINTNFSTYFIAILSTSVVAIINSRSIINRKTFNVFSVLMLMIGFILFFIASDKGCLGYGLSGYLLSLIFWVIASSDDPSFKEHDLKAEVDKGQQKHGKNWK